MEQPETAEPEPKAEETKAKRLFFSHPTNCFFYFDQLNARHWLEVCNSWRVSRQARQPRSSANVGASDCFVRRITHADRAGQLRVQFPLPLASRGGAGRIAPPHPTGTNCQVMGRGEERLGSARLACSCRAPAAAAFLVLSYRPLYSELENTDPLV
jgi:hypothetical protein